MKDFKKRLYIIIIIIGLIIFGVSYAASVAMHERSHNYGECDC